MVGQYIFIEAYLTLDWFIPKVSGLAMALKGPGCLPGCLLSKIGLRLLLNKTKSQACGPSPFGLGLRPNAALAWTAQRGRFLEFVRQLVFTQKRNVS
jgi:hypothetical protein